MSAQERQVIDTTTLSPPSDYEFSGDNATVERKNQFIVAYREHGSIYHAALAIRVNRKTVYRWMAADAEFAEALADCKEDCSDQVETSVFKKAVNGSTLDSIFYLKAHRPQFRDKITVDLSLVQDQIDSFIEHMNLKQLPAAMIGEFIDTGYSEASEEYQPVESNTMRFADEPASLQKEDSPTSSTCNIPNSE